MDVQSLLSHILLQCASLSERAQTVIGLWGQGKDLFESWQQGGDTRKQLINGLIDLRYNMVLNLGLLSIEMANLHTQTHGALSGLDYTDAKIAFLEKSLKPMIQAQEVLNRAQSAADMVSALLDEAVSGG